jgi:hypothetical protein
MSHTLLGRALDKSIYLVRKYPHEWPAPALVRLPIMGYIRKEVNLGLDPILAVLPRGVGAAVWRDVRLGWPD